MSEFAPHPVLPEEVPEVISAEAMEQGALEASPEVVEAVEVAPVVEAGEPEHVEETEAPAEEAEPKPKRHRAKKADKVETEEEPVVAAAQAAEAEETPEEQSEEQQVEPRTPRGPRAWLGALAARGAERQAARQEQRRVEEVAHAHAEAERELAREAASQLPANHTPAELRDKIASIREERAVAAQKAEDLARADALESEASRAYEQASQHVSLYEASRRMFEQAAYIADTARAQMEAARQGYDGQMGHAVELKRQADALRAAYAEPEAEPTPIAA